MRVAVFLTTPADVYSGGRYFAFMLAEALAYGGNETHVISDKSPLFLKDFEYLPNHSDIAFHLTQDFKENLPGGRFDAVVLVPATIQPGFYLRVQRFALERDAHLIFLNFETPNWFNAVSPYRRPEREWAKWKQWSRSASLILSISKEGSKWAERYYTPDSSQTRFDYVYPSINTAAADSVQEGDRERRVLLFMRFTKAKHKGSEDLEKILCDGLSGHTLVIILGRDDIPSETMTHLAAKAEHMGIEIELHSKPSDREKFEELKRVQLVLFPSLFEGFGYPPVEALYCNTPCVAFDLPVLRETCNGHLIFAEHNNWADFRAKLTEALALEPPRENTRVALAPLITLDALAKRLGEVLEFTTCEAPVDEADRPRRIRSLAIVDALRLNDFAYRYRRARSRFRWRVSAMMGKPLAGEGRR